MTYLSNVARSKGDPKVICTGPSSLPTSDRIARGLGWFSIGLGVLEMAAPERVTRALGMEGKESLIRLYGLREIGSGVLSLSMDKEAGLWSRVAGDGLDAATLLAAWHEDNPKKQNVGLALGVVAGIAFLDAIGAQRTRAQHARSAAPRNYGDRSGFPRGVAASRGLARQDRALPLSEPRAPAQASQEQLGTHV
jgi:hypothetical protein